MKVFVFMAIFSMIVFAVPQQKRFKPLLKVKLKMKKVRVHIVVTGNDGSTGTTSPTFTKKFTRQTVMDLVRILKKMYSKAGILIQFDPRTDITEVKSALLNEDVPFKKGKVVPNQSVDDLTGNPNVVAQRKFAENLTGHLVVYYRDFSLAKYTYIGSDGKKKRDVPWNFSGSQHLYVRAAKVFDFLKLPHEAGHYFHLAHTFGSDPKSIAGAAKMIKKAVESGDFSKKNGHYVFDYDRKTKIYDTPADPRGSVMAEVNKGDACGPVTTAPVTVTFSDKSKKTYYLKPDRQNIMSYFQVCQKVSTARFSNQQRKRMHASIDNGNRKHLVSQLPGRYTGVWKPGTSDQRMLYRWKYKYYRMKYDLLWKQGWRLHLLENHVEKGVVYYSAVFRKSSAPEIQLYGWSYDAYRKKYDELWKKGWRLYILNNYVLNGKVRYTVVFRKSKAAEIQLYGWSYPSYRKKYDEIWKKGWRLYILNNYMYKNKVRYTAVFRKSTSGEIQLYGWKYRQFREKSEQLWAKGLRLQILNIY